ncbi:hypothetical protein [Streptomyces sp. NPDC004528]|uniref:hypothetical protein n=1 Tax=Streptomyces sp. NPDC004528 TaxID=3154550 RepID=UPI0033B66533
MSSRLQELLNNALGSVRGDDPFAHLRRSSLKAAAEKAGLEVTPPVSEIQLCLSDLNVSGGEVAATEAGDFLQRVQRAVARLAKARRLRLADVARLSQSDVDFARLNVAAASTGSWIVELKYMQPDDGDESAESSSTWSEVGVVELIRALPEDEEDERSIESISAASPVIRRAVADLIADRSESNMRVAISARRFSGELLSSVITPTQARALREELSAVREEREVIRLRGRLDGLRTRRQIFYFETEDGREIHGYVDESLMNAVKQNLDQEVEIAVESFFNRARSGRTTQRKYRLIQVGGEQTQIPVNLAIDED